jgi:hypothetical protein
MVAPYEPEYAGPPNQHGGVGNKPISRLVVHATVSACCTSARSVAAMFRTTDRFASAHYTSDASVVLQTAYDSLICYHAPPNANSLGWELCCLLSNEGKGHWDKPDHRKMLHRAARGIAQTCLYYEIPIRKVGPLGLRAGRKGICGHIDVSKAWGQTNHWDPGPYFPWNWFINLIQKYADEILSGAPEKPSEDEPVTYTLKERAAGKGNDIILTAHAILRLGERNIGNERKRKRLRQLTRQWTGRSS